MHGLYIEEFQIIIYIQVVIWEVEVAYRCDNICLHKWTLYKIQTKFSKLRRGMKLRL